MENKSKSYKKKLIAALSALAVIGTAGVGTTLAYLTDSEQHTNTFTVGDVKIELEEPAYTALSRAAKTNIVPNEELPKNPFIRNSGVNDAIVFMKVTVPVEEVTWVADDGTKGTKKPQEIFFFKDTTDKDSYHGNHFDVNNNSADNTKVEQTVDVYINSGKSNNRISGGDNQETGRWIELTDLEKNAPQGEGTAVSQQAGSRTYVFGFSQPLKGSADSEAQAIWQKGTGDAATVYGTTNSGNTATNNDGRGANSGSNDAIRPLAAIEATSAASSDSRDHIDGTIQANPTAQDGKTYTSTGLDGQLVHGNVTYSEKTKRSVAEVWNTSSLFEKIQLKNILEDELAQGALRKIKIEAFAIQANDIILDGTSDHNSFPATKNITRDQLTKIYQIFMNQGTKATGGSDKDNGNSLDQIDTKVKEADTGNKIGLGGAQGETNVETGTYEALKADIVNNTANGHDANVAYNTQTNSSGISESRDNGDGTAGDHGNEGSNNGGVVPTNAPTTGPDTGNVNP
jgi:predicted ribosomally synthesized peptide with SipW-like signal peptide